MRKNKEPFQEDNSPFFLRDNKKEKQFSYRCSNCGHQEKIPDWAIAEFYTGVEEIDKDIPEGFCCPECDGIMYPTEGRERSER